MILRINERERDSVKGLRERERDRERIRERIRERDRVQKLK